MGFKPMTIYSLAFEISKEKAYEILKTRANGILKQKAYNILAFMGFKPIISNKNIPFSQITKEKALQSQDLMRFKPMTKYSPAFKVTKEKAYGILKVRTSGISKEIANYILAFKGFRPMISIAKYFSAYEISRESLKNSGFHGIQTHGPIAKYFSAYDISNKKAF